MKKYIDAINNTKFFINQEENKDTFLNSILEKLNNTSKIYIIGNGASCSMASHYATDFTKNCGIPAESLNDGSLLTCFINDFGFENSYKEMLKRKKIRDTDLLIAISSSGNSANIVSAVEYCYNLKIPCLSLTGFNINNDVNDYDIEYQIYIPADTYGEVEVAHNLWLHYIIDKFIEVKGTKKNEYLR